MTYASSSSKPSGAVATQRAWLSRISAVIRYGCAGVTLMLVSCSGNQSVLNPAGPGAKHLAFLGKFSFILFGATTLVTWVLLAIAALRRRGSLTWHAPLQAEDGKPWIWIGGFAIPVVTFGVLFVLTLWHMRATPLRESEHHSPEIRIVGHQWWWEVHYLGDSADRAFVTANELHIPTGQPIDIQLETEDVIHSFWVPRLHGKVDLIPGRKNQIRIQADNTGTFEGQCAEFCGTQHANMRLLVVAQSLPDYAAWVQEQLTPASAPATDGARSGQALFETRACNLCHTVRGTGAMGTVGPDLTHFGSRREIAGNSLPNKHAYVSAWVTRPQSFKSGILMPDMNVFTGPELEQLAQYLQGLH